MPECLSSMQKTSSARSVVVGGQPSKLWACVTFFATMTRSLQQDTPRASWPKFPVMSDPTGLPLRSSREVSGTSGGGFDVLHDCDVAADQRWKNSGLLVILIPKCRGVYINLHPQDLFVKETSHAIPLDIRRNHSSGFSGNILFALKLYVCARAT